MTETLYYCQLFLYRAILKKSFEPRHDKTCLTPYVNNKAADQPAHPCSLISTFVVLCLDNITSILSKSKVSRL